MERNEVHINYIDPSLSDYRFENTACKFYARVRQENEKGKKKKKRGNTHTKSAVI